MANYEKLQEEGYDFINLMQLPISISEYILHKNAIDIYIRNFKEKYNDRVDMWGWEMKNIFPGTYILSTGSILLEDEFLLELTTITNDKRDNVLQVFSPTTFMFKLDNLTESVDSFLSKTITDAKQIPLLQKLCSSSLDEQSKLIVGIMINPNFFLSSYVQAFPDMEFHSLDEEIFDALIDYIKRLKEDKNRIFKLFTMSNCILFGLSLDEKGKIEELIEESVNDSDYYDDVMVMNKINKYFEKKKQI